VVGRRGENFGVEKRWKKKKIRVGRMGFSFIRKTTSTGSSATGALVGVNSLQPRVPTSISNFMECSEFVLFIAVSFREFSVDILRDFASQF
jgi:hypothetical protein